MAYYLIDKNCVAMSTGYEDAVGPKVFYLVKYLKMPEDRVGRLDADQKRTIWASAKRQGWGVKWSDIGRQIGEKV